MLYSFFFHSIASKWPIWINWLIIYHNHLSQCILSFEWFSVSIRSKNINICIDANDRNKSFQYVSFTSSNFKSVGHWGCNRDYFSYQTSIWTQERMNGFETTMRAKTKRTKIQYTSRCEWKCAQIGHESTTQNTNHENIEGFSLYWNSMHNKENRNICSTFRTFCFRLRVLSHLLVFSPAFVSENFHC